MGECVKQYDCTTCGNESCVPVVVSADSWPKNYGSGGPVKCGICNADLNIHGDEYEDGTMRFWLEDVTAS